MQELAFTAGKALVTINVKSGGGAPFQVEGYEGMSLKLIAESGTGKGAEILAECLECACNGVMACSTCQVSSVSMCVTASHSHSHKPSHSLTSHSHSHAFTYIHYHLYLLL